MLDWKPGDHLVCIKSTKTDRKWAVNLPIKGNVYIIDRLIDYSYNNINFGICVFLEGMPNIHPNGTPIPFVCDLFKKVQKFKVEDFMNVDAGLDLTKEMEKC